MSVAERSNAPTSAGAGVTESAWNFADLPSGSLGTSSETVATLTRTGFVHYAAGSYDRAAALFTAATEISADQPLTWNNLALAFGALGQLDSAVDALRRSLALQPVQPDIWISLANNLLRLDQVDSAETALRSAIAIDDTVPAAWQILALVRTKREEFASAADAFTRALSLKGEDAALRTNLGVVLFRAGRFADAAESLRMAMAGEAASAEIHQTALLARLTASALAGSPPQDLLDECLAVDGASGGAGSGADRLFKIALLTLDQFGHRAAAARIVESWIACRPFQAEPRHLRDALMGRTINRMPAQTVAQQFDAYADHFDRQLVDRLDYSVPAQIGALLDGHLTRRALDILDVGCGTGLCAPHLKPYARHLAGVDLSPRMVAKAQERGLYDELEVEELLTTLDRTHRRWDVIAAGDVLAYFGDLESLFDGVACALKPGGIASFRWRRSTATALPCGLLAATGTATAISKASRRDGSESLIPELRCFAPKAVSRSTDTSSCCSFRGN